MQYAKTIAKFFEAAANPDLWADALQAISEATGARGALLTTPVFIPGGLAHSRELAEAVHQFFDEAWYKNDVRTNAVRDHHFENGFFSDHSLFSEQEMAASEYYEKFAGKAGVPWFAAGRLKGGLAQDAVAISLQRSAAQGAFSADELATLNAILPYLEPSMVLASRIAEAKGRALMDGLQLARQAAVLIKPDGAVASVNAAAEKLLGRRLLVRHQRLVCATAPQHQQLEALIARACQAVRTFDGLRAPLKPVMLPASETEGRLVIAAAPILRSGADAVSFSGVIVMITQPAFGVHIPEAAIQSLFALTAREAAVMSLIGRGQPLRGVAHMLGIGHETVRYHLKSVLGKTGATRQSDLVALCSALYPVVGDDGS